MSILEWNTEAIKARLQELANQPPTSHRRLVHVEKHLADHADEIVEVYGKGHSLTAIANVLAHELASHGTKVHPMSIRRMLATMVAKRTRLRPSRRKPGTHAKPYTRMRAAEPVTNHA